MRWREGSHPDVEEREGGGGEEEDERNEIWTLPHRVLDARTDAEAFTVSAARGAAAIRHCEGD